MKARLAVCLAFTTMAIGVPVASCGGNDATTAGDGGDGGQDSTAGNDSSPGDSAAEASRGGFGMEAGQDGSGTDASRDGSGTDTGASDGTTGTDGAPRDVTATDTGADAAADAGPTQGSGVDSGTNAVLDGGVDAAIDSGPDAGAGGPQCLTPDGGRSSCNLGEHCCVLASTRTATCAATCDPDAGAYPVDCTGSSAAGQCGSQLCCGTLVLGGGIIPNCSASSLTASCAASCTDTPPGALSNCTGSYSVRLCNAAADCASDTGRPSCCSFGSSPVAWCVDTTTALGGTCLP